MCLPIVNRRGELDRVDRAAGAVAGGMRNTKVGRPSRNLLAERQTSWGSRGKGSRLSYT
jgi:hypothetical protein